MATNHPHTHTMHTECDGDGCNRQHHEEFSHSHDGGHDYHNHKLEGMKMVKTNDMPDQEDEPESESEPKNRYGF